MTVLIVLTVLTVCAGSISMDMMGKIVVFKVFPRAGRHRTDLFVKKFYGQDGTTGHGKYHFRRKGLLEEIPHRKLIRGVIIIRQEDEERIVGFLKQYDAEYYSRDIVLAPDDQEVLQQKTPPR